VLAHFLRFSGGSGRLGAHESSRSQVRPAESAQPFWPLFDGRRRKRVLLKAIGE
jgi:hypothetical protein